MNVEQRTLLDLLDRRLADDPHGPFLDCCGAPYTAAGIDTESNRVANSLALLGAGHGSTVATMLENGPAAVLSWFAIHKLGAISVPVDTALRGPRLRHVLADAGAAVVIVQDDLAGRPRALLNSLDAVRHLVVVDTGAAPGEPSPPAGPDRGKARLHAWADLRAAADIRPDALVRPGDLGTIVYTGGATGPAKGCALSHNYHLSIARQINASWGRRPDDVVWSPLPLSRFDAISCMLTGTLLGGGRAALSRRFSVSGFWPEIDRIGATIAALPGPPAALVARADDHPRAKGAGGPEANTTLRLLSGAPIPPEIDRIYRDRFGLATFSDAYGTTEASLISWLPPGRPGKPGSAGVVDADTFDVRIFDDAGREVPAGAEGEIVCRPRSPHAMFEGYWGRPEATVSAWRDLWFHTGDIGRIDEEGYLFFVDRKSDRVRRRIRPEGVPRPRREPGGPAVRGGVRPVPSGCASHGESGASPSGGPGDRGGSGIGDDRPLDDRHPKGVDVTDISPEAGELHPALAGRTRESEALADAVRRLVGLCTSTTAPAETTMAAARELEAVADRLERHVPDPPHAMSLLQADLDDGPDTVPDLGARMPFDVVVGRHNPLALPLDVSFEPPKALLRGTFTRPYQGPPGCVHGAVLAASFDLVCAAANVIAGLPGPTARLEIRYRRPTLLDVPCLFEGEVESHEGRRVRTVGRLLQGDEVTVEATGDFVKLDRADIARMSGRAG